MSRTVANDGTRPARLRSQAVLPGAVRHPYGTARPRACCGAGRRRRRTATAISGPRTVRERGPEMAAAPRSGQGWYAGTTRTGTGQLSPPHTTVSAPVALLRQIRAKVTGEPGQAKANPLVRYMYGATEVPRSRGGSAVSELASCVASRSTIDSTKSLPKNLAEQLSPR